jgi:co-chaperonin GroES (HSP10)
VLTEDGTEKPKSGTVIKLGTHQGKVMSDGSKFEFAVKEGSKVFWSYPGRDIEIDGEKYLVMREADLLGFEE